MLGALIGEDIELTTHLDPALGPIEADPGQLEQVVMNLVVNARDAMPDGGMLTIETRERRRSTRYARRASDRARPLRHAGRSATPARAWTRTTLGQIFEPFFTTKEAGKGTGLGLATVYGIVKQSGGYVEVESEVGIGSAFRIYLRRVDDTRHRPEPAAFAPQRRAQRDPGHHAGAGRRGRGGRSRPRRQMLVGQGYEVLVAQDGDGGARPRRAAHIDVLLTDLTMPDVGGREVAERLREAQPDLKVIYMSGYAEDYFPTGALPPSTSFLGKPFTFAELTETVRTLIAAP